MKNRISKILILLLITASVAIGFTISYFQDIEKSESNIFSAGTLDLKPNDKDGVEATWRGENMMPGMKLKEK